MDDSLLTIIVGIAMVVGIAGTILPVVPGVSLVWGAALVYGIVHGFSDGGWLAFGLITLLAIIGVATNVVLPGRRADKAGASGASILLGVIGAVVGLFAIPLIGLPVGGAIGIFAGEKMQGRSTDEAWVSTKETLIGIGLSILAQFVIAVWMTVVWVVWTVVS